MSWSSPVKEHNKRVTNKFLLCTSKTSGAHVALLLLKEFSLLIGQRQSNTFTVVGSAETNDLLVRALHVEHSRLVL